MLLEVSTLKRSPRYSLTCAFVEGRGEGVGGGGERVVSFRFYSLTACA